MAGGVDRLGTMEDRSSVMVLRERSGSSESHWAGSYEDNVVVRIKRHVYKSNYKE